MSDSAPERRARLTIRSYRPVFRLEKRWYTIDRWRIPWAYGVPQRAVGYFAVALVALVALDAMAGGRLTGSDARVGAAVFLLLPAAIAGACSAYRPDGRDLPSGAWALVRWRFGRRQLLELHRGPPAPPRPCELVAVPDALERRYRAARIRGPARVTFRYPIALRGDRRRRRIRGRPLPGGPLRRRDGATVALTAGSRLEIR